VRFLLYAFLVPLLFIIFAIGVGIAIDLVMRAYDKSEIEKLIESRENDDAVVDEIERQRRKLEERIGELFPLPPSSLFTKKYPLSKDTKTIKIKKADVVSTCPLCYEEAEDDNLVKCDKCGAIAHKDCVSEMSYDKCPTYGCERKMEKVKV